MSAIEYVNSTTLLSTATSVTFSSLPQNYIDLIAVISCTTTASVYVGCRLNGASTNYSGTILWGNGSSSGSYRGTTAGWSYILIDPPCNSGEANRSVYRFEFLNYTNANSFKRVIGTGARASVGIGVVAGMYSATPIVATTSITFMPGDQSFEAGSTFTLWGVK
jgi:hypothetical protein